MAKSPTPNYGLIRPTDGRSGGFSNDPMNDFDVQINPNWDEIADAASPPSGTTLPQSGSYNVGDRFYKTDTQSIYLLIVKSAVWGWHWRPIQDAISPWLEVPTTCMEIAGWTLNSVATNPFAIAFDHRGKCYWRGLIGPTAGNISRNVSHSVFKPLPVGLKPRCRGAYMLGHSVASVGTTSTALDAWQGARIFIPDDPTAFVTVRAFGGTADFNRVHLTGVNYAVGESKYLTP